MIGNEENSYMQEKCRQGSGETVICRNTANGMGENNPFQEQYRQESGEKTVDNVDRRGKHFLGTVRTVGEQPVMGGVEKIKWKNSPLWAQCRYERGASVLWVWCRHERWKELFLGTVLTGMWVNIFFCGQGTHEKEKWASHEKWRQESSCFSGGVWT